MKTIGLIGGMSWESSLQYYRLIKVIYDELCRGTVNPASKRLFLEIIAELVARGAEGVILGCTP